MKKYQLGLGLLLFGFLFGNVGLSQANTISTLFNTGVGANGVALPDGTIGDTHYSLASVPGGTTNLLVRTAAGGFPFGPGLYFTGNSNSAWIGPYNDPSLNSPVGNYDYRTTFSLAGFNPSTALISGGWSSDNNGVKILLNGIDTGNSGTSFAQFQNGFAAFNINSGFKSGINTLDFIVSNGGVGLNPTALRVDMSGTALVPEPTEGALMLSGIGLLGFIASRRKKSA